MRDDLGVYLKVLRSAMIELINEDYADFVNLASNLCGLDQQIGGIQAPLQQLRTDIVAVKDTLTDTMTELNECLDEKRQLRRDLQAVQAADKVRRALDNIDALLTAAAAADGETVVDQTVLERAAMEYVQVTFEMQFCGEQLANADETPTCAERIESLHRKLLAALEAHFLQTLGEPNAGGEQLERCLRVFGTLDECHVAEDIFRRRVVAPHMHPIIAESALQNSPQGVHGIYAQVLAFVEARMLPLLALTRPTAERPVCKVRGFDFLLRAYWPEVEQRLETHMSSIFAPGNPDQFYQKYDSTVEFLRSVERLLGPDEAAIVAFKQLPQYKSFQTRWNLPVYFQIRFQEIGATLETACSRNIGTTGTWTTVGSGAKLTVIATAIECFRKCWSDGVYLPQIFMRFWKLSLQILARTANWLDEFVALSEWPAAAAAATTSPPVAVTLMDALVVCHADVRLLVDELPALLAMVLRQQDGGDRVTREPLLRRCLDESGRTLGVRLSAIETRLVNEIVTASVASIRQVNDIPRLFRKTNRDMPSKAAPYVDQMLRAAVKFADVHRASVGDRVLLEMLLSVFCQLNAQ